MSDRKTTIRFYDVMDYEKEAAYLSAMHKKGWKFVYVSMPGFYHFVKCEPEDVRYQLDYNQDGMKNKEEYKQMFADMGWEYILDFMGYTYFRKPVSEEEGDEEIFCDDDSRWDMVKRIFRGRIVPLIIVFFCCLVPAMTRAIWHFGNRDDAFAEALVPIAVFVILYVSIFIRFTVKYFSFKKKVGR